MNTTLESLEALVKTVRQLADTYPDFAYVPATQPNNESRCAYNTGGCDKYPGLSGCIIGQAVRKLNVDIPANMNLVGVQPILLLLPGVTATELKSEVNVVKIAAWLQTVQAYQDSEKSWASAVSLADAEKNKNKPPQE